MKASSFSGGRNVGLPVRAMLPLILIAVLSLPASGAEWQAEVHIGPYAMWSVSGPAVASGSDGWIHIVWSEQIGEDQGNQVFYRTGEGTNWSPPLQLSNSSMTMDPSIVIDRAGRIHVAWVDIDGGSWGILARRFESGAWTPPVRVDNGIGRRAGHPRLAADPGGTVDLVWEQEESLVPPFYTNLYYSHWDGNAWSAQEALTAGTFHAQQGAIAVAPNGDVHVAWQDDRNGTDQVYHRQRVGGSWSPATMIGSGAHPLRHPDIAVTPLGDVWAVMTRDSYLLQVCTSRLIGGQWYDPMAVTDGDSDYARLAVSRCDDAHADVHVVWQEVVGGKSAVTYLDIHPFRPDVRQQITDGTADAVHPVISADPICNLDVVWFDNREGFFLQDVYYREGINAAADVSELPAVGAHGISSSPNPFTNQVTFRLDGAACGTLRIFDAAGRAVRSIPVANAATVVWDGTSDTGLSVGTGVFLYRFDGSDEIGRIIRLR